MSTSSRGAHRAPASRHQVLARRVVTVAATAVLLVGGSGLAHGAWTATGGGTTTAVAGTALAPTTTAVPGSAVTTGLLYPGGPSGTAKVTVNNPNPYPVRIAAITPNGSATASASACTTTGVTFTTQQGVGTRIAAEGSATATLDGAVSMDTSSVDGCQGATFTIPVRVSIESG